MLTRSVTPTSLSPKCCRYCTSLLRERVVGAYRRTLNQRGIENRFHVVRALPLCANRSRFHGQRGSLVHTRTNSVAERLSRRALSSRSLFLPSLQATLPTLPSRMHAYENYLATWWVGYTDAAVIFLHFCRFCTGHLSNDPVRRTTLLNWHSIFPDPEFTYWRFADRPSISEWMENGSGRHWETNTRGFELGFRIAV